MGYLVGNKGINNDIPRVLVITATIPQTDIMTNMAIIPHNMNLFPSVWALSSPPAERTKRAKPQKNTRIERPARSGIVTEMIFNSRVTRSEKFDGVLCAKETPG